WLELLREAIPQLSRIAVLWDPATARTPRNAVEQAAGSLAIQLDIIEVRTRSDFEQAFVTATQRAAGAVLMLQSPLIGANAQPLAELAIHHRLPAVTLFPDFARAGGLLAYRGAGDTPCDTRAVLTAGPENEEDAFINLVMENIRC